MEAISWWTNDADLARQHEYPGYRKGAAQRLQRFESYLGGRWLYFLSDRNGPVSLFSFDPATKQVKQVVENRGLISRRSAPGLVRSSTNSSARSTCTISRRPGSTPCRSLSAVTCQG